MKKIILTILILSLFLVGCATTNDDSNEDRTVKVALLLSGNLGDMSFLDSGKKGVDLIQSEHSNVEVRVVEMGADSTQYEPNVLDFSDEGYDIIIGSGWQLQEPFQNVSEDYPDTTYILYSSEVDYSKSEYKNVYSINFKMNEGSYLAGVMSAGMSETGVLGFLGGADGPGINDFLVGYIEGAKSVNPDIKVLVGYIGDFNDGPRAKEMSIAQYNQGADVIFTAAGASGIGTLEAAEENGKWAVGVDSDQAMLFDGSNQSISSHIPSSVLQNIDVTLLNAFEQYMDGSLKVGQVDLFGVADEAVGLATNKYYEDLVPSDVKELIDSANDKIISGDVQVTSAFGMENAALQDLIESVRP